MSKRVKLRASETDEQLEAVSPMEAGDEATARQMSIVAQGMIALLSLQKNNPKAARLADGISIKQDGATVTATLAVPRRFDRRLQGIHRGKRETAGGNEVGCPCAIRAELQAARRALNPNLDNPRFSG